MHSPNVDPIFYPIPILTPGSIDGTLTAAQATDPRWVPTRRRVTHATKNAVYVAYGIAPTDRTGYEIDHLVCLGLGGSNFPSNLWPAPLSGLWPNALKTRLEDTLIELVRAGRLTLKDAQAYESLDWIAAYQQFVLGVPSPAGTWPDPLPVVASAAPDLCALGA